MIKAPVMVSRRCQSAAFDMKVVSPYIPKQQFILMFTRTSTELVVMISQGSVIRQVRFDGDVVGDDAQSFLAVQDPAAIAAGAVSTGESRELDCEAFFDAAALGLASLNNQQVRSQEDYTSDLEMLAFYRESEDPEAFVTYLQLENLLDVVEDSMIYRIKDDEVQFWKAVWKSVISKSVSINIV